MRMREPSSLSATSPLRQNNDSVGISTHVYNERQLRRVIGQQFQNGKCGLDLQQPLPVLPTSRLWDIPLCPHKGAENLTTIYLYGSNGDLLLRPRRQNQPCPLLFRFAAVSSAAFVYNISKPKIIFLLVSDSRKRHLQRCGAFATAFTAV